MMKLKIIVVAAIFTMSAGISYAQTAEETVAYMTKGLLDGAKLDYLPGIIVRQISNSPASFKIEGGGRSSTWTFVKVDLCHYDVQTISPRGNIESIAVDLTNFYDVRISNKNGYLQSNIDGMICTSKSKTKLCSELPDVDWFSPSDAKRIEKAVGYFRTNFCPGRAF